MIFWNSTQMASQGLLKPIYDLEYCKMPNMGSPNDLKWTSSSKLSVQNRFSSQNNPKSLCFKISNYFCECQHRPSEVAQRRFYKNQAILASYFQYIGGLRGQKINFSLASKKPLPRVILSELAVSAHLNCHKTDYF